IFNTPQIAGVIQNNSFVPPFPSFNYEDLGLTLKAKPLVTANSNVSLNVEMQVRSLGTTSLNGVPVISNREYKGSINLLDGEPAQQKPRWRMSGSSLRTPPDRCSVTCRRN